MNKPRTRRSKLAWSLAEFAVAAAVCTAVFRTHPVSVFERAARKIAAGPRTETGEPSGLSTYPDDQPLFGRFVTSRTINEETVWAFHFLRSKLDGIPVTYYAEPGSMPTQETIWQYPGYFVRLYVTSSLDSDGAEVGVFAGTYEEFREGRISGGTGRGRSDLYSHFAPLAFAAPERFLAHR